MKRGKKLQTNLSNKTYYTFLALAFLLVVGGIVLAYNSNPPNPSVMGHTANEIEGLEDYVRSIVRDEMSTSTSCSSETLLFDSFTDIPARQNPTYGSVYYMDSYRYTDGITSVPASCKDTPCFLKQEIYQKNLSRQSNLASTRFYDYYQDSATGKWTVNGRGVAYSQSAYTNGDLSFANIFLAYQSLYFWDDYRYSTLTTEISKDNFIFADVSVVYDMKVSLCTEQAP